jgi:hypothetical protein
MSTTTTKKPTPPAFTPPTPSPEYLATQKVAQRLTELCASGKNQQAMQELYADNVRHVEVMDMPGCPRITEGKAALLQKAEKFARTAQIHSASCGKPMINGDQFVCTMTLDCTSSEGPMAGQRMNMSETALYTVKNGKIVEGRFFYSCGM